MTAAMNPIAMALLLSLGFGVFLWNISKRWRLLVSATRALDSDHHSPALRFKRLVLHGLLQSKLRRYPAAGWAHTVVFLGFVVLLARTLVLWGRGFDPTFSLGFLGEETTAGAIYNQLKDCAAIGVVIAVVFFLVQRTIVRPRRLNLSTEGVAILLVIATMMLADGVYDGANLLLARSCVASCQGAVRLQSCAQCSALPRVGIEQLQSIVWRIFPDPLGSLAAVVLQHLPARLWHAIAQAGYWTHASLVVAFLNWLPYSKHFHVITALPNVYFAPTTPPGKLHKLAANAEELLEKADALQNDPSRLDLSPIGIGAISDLGWKHRLDLFTCTECGRCTEHCPAFRVGKPLNPKLLTLSLRNELYTTGSRSRVANDDAGVDESLVPRVIEPETIWSCTTCRACEEQCPVDISYVDKIVDLRRNLVLMRGELPHELQRSFDGIEHSGNPWNLPRSERAQWAADLGVSRLSEVEHSDWLYWVGCAASYDKRAQSVARAFVKLLQKANVSFAILGDEESCTGDVARRAGNEFLFLQMAESNVQRLNSYYEQKRFDRIVTACPHCLTTLKHEYPDFGGQWPVFHHQQLLLQLVQDGLLKPNQTSQLTSVFHDPCTLARYAQDTVSPRNLLKKLPGLELREAEHHGRATLCCGAGGARYFMEDAPTQRINAARATELSATGAARVITACPFCTSMLEDGLASSQSSGVNGVLDIAEVLEQACR